MVIQILSYIVILWVTLLPVYLWGYMMTFFLEEGWNRTRFWTGTIIGSMTVLLVYVFSLFESYPLGLQVGALAVFFLVLFLGVLLLTRIGSIYARGFLSRIAFLHSVIIFGLLAVFLFFTYSFPTLLPITSSLFSLILAAYIEESAKHLSSIGLLGKDFSFTQKDVILLTVFVVLGFTFAENILYLAHRAWGVGEWVFRSIFTIFAHIFLSTLCSYFWWRALSEKIFSLRYFGFFLLGLLLAGGLHFLYNFFLETNRIAFLCIFLAFGYIFFTRIFTKKLS